jgi:hypothetical protein
MLYYAGEVANVEQWSVEQWSALLYLISIHERISLLHCCRGDGACP